ncbi:hypothetical protein DMENIID0001_022190 [Sergentomyia squamirostris]
MNGSPANPTDYPHHVRIRIYGGESGTQFIGYCSGSIILCSWILTSGPCTPTFIPFPNMLNYVIEAGIDASGQPQQTARVPASNTFRHPQNSDPFDNNLSLLKLPTPFVMTDRVNLIKLAPVSWSGPDTLNGVKGTGSGFISNSGPNSNNLQSVDLTVIPQTDCNT